MFRISFVAKDYVRIMRATYQLERIALREKNDLPLRCSVEMTNIIRNRVWTQRMPTPTPYVDRYKKWKMEHGLFQIYWALFGDFVGALQPFKVQGGWKAGIPSGVYDSGGKSWYGQGGKRKPIAMYAYVMEFGGHYGRGGYHPPRPLFGPAMDEYKQYGLPRQINVSRKKIKDGWK